MPGTLGQIGRRLQVRSGGPTAAEHGEPSSSCARGRVESAAPAGTGLSASAGQTDGVDSSTLLMTSTLLRRVLPVCLALCIRQGSAAEQAPQLGVSLLTLTNPFFRDLGEAMKDEAAKGGL